MRCFLIFFLASVAFAGPNYNRCLINGFSTLARRIF